MHSLLFAIVTFAWLLIQGFVGARLLMPKGRPYKVPVAVLHVLLFLPIAAGWYYTVTQLTMETGSHPGSWISEIVMGAGVAWMLIVGIMLIGGRKIPAAKGLVDAHRLGMLVVTLGGLGGIVSMLIGV
jgi:hypothetical protein